MQNAPFTMLTLSQEQRLGNDRYEGYVVDLLQRLSRLLGFKYIIQPVRDGSYGSRDKTTGRWNGMIKDILDGVSFRGCLYWRICMYRWKDMCSFNCPVAFHRSVHQEFMSTCVVGGWHSSCWLVHQQRASRNCGFFDAIHEFGYIHFTCRPDHKAPKSILVSLTIFSRRLDLHVSCLLWRICHPLRSCKVSSESSLMYKIPSELINKLYSRDIEGWRRMSGAIHTRASRSQMN